MLILKKGNGKEVEVYRRVTLMPTLYKIYLMVLEERLKEEVEGKGKLIQNIPQTQTGIRKKMGTIENIYLLNYVANKEIGKKGKKSVVMFVDLKAAFDTVNRGVLMETMRERGSTKKS